ncbi:FkbM family methyltransferase [Flavobacterium nackdongense]|uniref:FkbM family methyltransferase n=1 Tax=Flavobacterium nackdongense TaxID=2547394 RepID=A0A4P6YHA0_9FLAO|nr:FkbM family methyltransferase [Flavobacterium nackdongense]QBN19863.1 FkbM family methyltransferase [Flavobacterium nackdongense]
MKNIINKAKNKIREFIYKRYNISFSQGGGDDIQLTKLIKAERPGVYVDIGCWHPVKASNTYYFYLRGWKGICIDPNPELKTLYDKFRPKDSFINCAIGPKEKSLTYYQLNDNYSTMNTLNYDFIKLHNLENQIKCIVNVPIYNLKDILDKNILEGDRLDFFDIDVEGFDLEVLKSNDWVKYRPKVVLVETDLTIQNDINSEIVQYLETVDYKLVAKSIINGNLGNLFLMDNKIN